MLSTLDAQRRVFVNEMGPATSLGPVYAYSLRGHRAYAKIPRRRGPNATLLLSISVKGMGPSLAVEGPGDQNGSETTDEGASEWQLLSRATSVSSPELIAVRGKKGRGITCLDPVSRRQHTTGVTKG